MVARNGGNLTAAGTSDRRILLTGTGKVRGHWRGLGLSATDSRLNHVVIEYGGGAIIGFGTQQPANLQVSTGGVGTTTKVSVSNTTLRESSGYGLYARSVQVDLADFSNNVLTQNTLGPAFVDAPIVDRLMEGVYTGNTVDRIGVHTNGVPITANATWRNLGVPFLIIETIALEGFQVTGPATLTIAPGVEIIFQDGMGLAVREGGILSAIGTATERIRFRGDDVRWKGIAITASQASFDHLDIDGGGSAKWSGVNEAGNFTVRAGGGTSMAIWTNNVVSSGADFGVVFSLGAAFGQVCPVPTYIPPPDEYTDHCLPLGGIGKARAR